MELLRGETLKEALRQGPLSVTEVITFSRQAAAALAAAHAQGVVHRDIKPANIFVSQPVRGTKQIKILDFGLAKQQGVGDLQDSGEATATFGGLATSAETDSGRANPDLTSPGSTLGTVAYMSPEQAKGEPLDARTDLFSLGAVIHEMATGSKPFAGHSTRELFVALLTKDPAPVSAMNPALPVELDGIVAKLLAKEKEERYQTAEEVLQDLEAIDAQASHRSSGGAVAASGNARRGQFRAAAATLQQAAGQAGEAKAPDAQAGFLLSAAFIGWPVGECQNPEAAVTQALAMDRSKSTQIGVAATQAFCGEGNPALVALDVLEKNYPEDTLVQQVFVPQARAYVALEAGDAQKALELLAKSQAFDLVLPGPYLRGLAYLQLHDAGNATASFKMATKYKGASYTNQNNNILFPMNYYVLGLLA